MISLKPQTEPYDIELPYGVTATARRRIENLEAQARERAEAGLPADSLPDFADKAEHEGVFQDLLIKELGTRHITAWSGVEDDPPVTPENVAAVMELCPVGERFFQEFTLRQVLLNAAKKRIRALCCWHFRPGGGPGYCEGCRQEGEVGVEGHLCLYHEHALRTLEEHQAWDVLLPVSASSGSRHRVMSSALILVSP